MRALRTVLTFGLPPSRVDAGLLILRVGIGITLFLRHGIPKILGFSQMAAHFPDPIHIGSHASLLYAILSDAICSILIILGLFTRIAALIVFVNVFTVWVLLQHFAFFGKALNGEMVVLFVVSSLAILVAGAGRFSIDSLLVRKETE